jgi:hypothetical protein
MTLLYDLEGYAIALIYSPWVKRSGARFNPAVLANGYFRYQ